MGLLIDRFEAKRRFATALVLAREEALELPEEWLHRTFTVGRAKSRTFIAALGTALLAKATDDAVDALSLREDESHKGYSARSLAKEVLVPCCVNAGIDLRIRGAEPLNNQPFLRASRISLDLNVKPNARDDLKYLVECLQRADFLRGQDALHAFAAFLRIRLCESSEHIETAFPDEGPDPSEVRDALKLLVEGDSEGGRVGQALTASILELAYSNVRTKKVNDPSVEWPGDVGIFDPNGNQTGSAEIKQRPFTESEILQFAARLGGVRVSRGLVVAFGQGGKKLDIDQLRYQAARLYQVQLDFVDNITDLLELCLRFSDFSPSQNLQRLLSTVVRRMEELEVTERTRNSWVERFRGHSQARNEAEESDDML